MKFRAHLASCTYARQTKPPQPRKPPDPKQLVLWWNRFRSIWGLGWGRAMAAKWAVIHFCLLGGGRKASTLQKRHAFLRRWSCRPALRKLSVLRSPEFTPTDHLSPMPKAAGPASLTPKAARPPLHRPPARQNNSESRFSKYFKIFQNISKYFQIFLKYFKIFLKYFQIFLKYFEIFSKNQYIKIFQNISKYFQIFLKYFQIFLKKIQIFLKYFQIFWKTLHTSRTAFHT